MSELENNIRVLNYPENVRLRAGMYIGSTENPNVILREVIDNSIDEVMLPTAANLIKIQVDSEIGECIVGDNGRGIPDIIDEDLGISKLEVATSKLHAGGKFDKGKAASVGLNGVGIKATNALSSVFEIWSSGLHIVYNRGIKVSEDRDWNLPEGFEGLSTVTRFIPDSEIFKNIVPEIPTESFKFAKLICSELGKSDIHIIVNGLEDESSLELPRFNVKYGSVYTDPSGVKYPYQLSVYFDWEIGRTYESHNGTVNGVHCPNGYHINWNENHLRLILARKLGISDPNLLNLGLNFFVAVIASEVEYDSQTKVRLSNIIGFNSDEVYSTYESGIINILNSDREFFDKLKKSTDIYRDSAIRAQEVREINGLLQGTVGNTRKADKIKSKLMATSVKDCSTLNRKDAELYLCEGKSAGGTLIKARNAAIHSILPLRGKPLSVFNLDYRALLQNREWLNFVLTVGGGIDKLCDVSKVRYGKIIIACDADPDGMAIAISLLGGIGTHLRYLIDNELLYVLETPLYLDTRSNIYYYLGDEDKVDFGSGKIRRFKGLGEFSPSQFKDFAFNKEKRKLVKVTSEMIDEALDLIRNTEPKKQLMINNGYLEIDSILESDFDNIKLQHV